MVFSKGILVTSSIVFAAAAGHVVPQAFGAGSASDSTEQSDSALADIVVTAQRRSENLQRVPIAITAVTADTLKNASINDTNALQALVPGVVVDTQVGSSMIFVRGVGTTAIGTENSVASYIDGVYVATQAGALMLLNNIDRIEVLKGPQGTLFGRNATGGVVSVITRDPSLTSPSADVSLGYGNFQTATASLYASAPLISDVLAADVAFYSSDQERGWGHNFVTGREIGESKNFAGRSKWIFEPSDATKITFAVDYSQIRSDVGLNNRFIGASRGIDGVSGFPGFYNSLTGLPEFFKNTSGGAMLDVDQDLGWGHFVSISSYRESSSFINFDQDGTPLNIVTGVPLINKDRTITEEIHLLSEQSSTVKWILGGFFLHDVYGTDPTALQGAVAFPFSSLLITSTLPTNSYAVFTQGTYQIVRDTNLTLGLRYTVDERSAAGWTQAITSQDISIPLTSGSQSQNFDKLTYRVSLDHQFTPKTLGYVSYNRGFKSGEFNVVTYADAPVKPEVLDAYEIGSKTQIFDDRARINTALYYYDYKNIQIQSIVAGSVQLENAAAAQIWGADMDVSIKPIDRLLVTGGMAFAHGVYTNFPNAPVYAPSQVGGDVLVPGINGAGFTTVHTPKFSLTMNADYEVPTTTAGKIDFILNLSHTSSFDWDPDNRVKQPTVDLLGATIRWTAPGEKWDTRIWGKNLLNRGYYTIASDSAFGDYGSPAAPRTYGVEVGYHFH